MSLQLRSWAGTALTAGAVTVLNWPSWQRAAPGLDSSWQAGLALAFTRHMQWGPQLDFTYGPYGFAGFVEPFYRLTAGVALAYVFAVTWALAALLVAGLRAYWGLKGYQGLVLAGVISWAAIALSWEVRRTADFAGVLGLGLAFAILRAPSGPWRTALATTLGAMAGFTLLVKLNTGLVMVVLLVLALAGASGSGPRLRAGLAAGAAFAGTFAIAWAAARQSFANLPGFTRYSVSLALGYSSAMNGRLPRSSIAWSALAIGAVAAAALAAGWRHRPRREQAAGLLMVGAWGWAVVKDGFVASNHYPEFFRIVLVATALSCLLRPPRLVYGAAVVLAAGITLLTVTSPGINPVTSLRALGPELADVAQAGRFSDMTAATRARVLEEEHLAPGLVRSLRGRTVAIEPWEDMIAWADPGLIWDPEPVVQSYSAFTTSVDRLDATFLSSRQAPQVLLFQRTGFAGRDPWMDPPATMGALYCRYREVGASGPWLVLGHVADRCGRPQTLAVLRSRFGVPMRVPRAPGKIVAARFVLAVPLAAELEAGLLKPPAVYLSIWDGRGAVTRYRFVPGTAGDEHVLVVPATLGYAARFSPAPAREIEFSGGGWGAGQGTVTVSFEELSLRILKPFA